MGLWGVELLVSLTSGFAVLTFRPQRIRVEGRQISLTKNPLPSKANENP